SLPPVFRPFPPDCKHIDSGSDCADWTRIRTELNWQPRIRFDEGMSQSLLFYRNEPRYAFRQDSLSPACGVQEEVTEIPKRFAVS
ncbi:MAG: hypothetical protein ACUVXB_15835, partial [Bryobacteraceae bacterium]